MAAIGDFVDLVDQRTLPTSRTCAPTAAACSSVQIAILVVIVLVGAGALVVTTRVVLRPLDR